MNKVNFAIALFLFIFADSGFASQIKRISLSELHAKSDLVIMAEVTEVAKEQNQDYVTVLVDSYLKGSSAQKVYTLTLVTRGGLKDFDPSLKKGDTGVFFLKLKEQKGHVEKAYWGGVATFQKNHFYVADKESGISAAINLSTSLDAWCFYRVKCNQVGNIDEYERGFRKGFTGPPGLVDGSSDFNLGHSDGMLAKTGRLPNMMDAGDGK